jgi:hypothetical protein
MKILESIGLSLRLLTVRPVPGMVLVSASDSSHVRSLCNWLRSAARHEPDTETLVYDLGLAPAERDALRACHPRVTLRKFEYQNYPAFFDVKTNAGEYAWKPAIIHEVMVSSQAPVCWMDAGNLITAPLARLRRILAKYGFYSPRSSGRIRDWTHPATLRALGYPPSRLGRRNLNGACIAFDCAHAGAQALLEAWYRAALEREIIAPAGSDRTNHRQDQAVLSALFHNSSLSDAWPAKSCGFLYQGFLTHQDVEE